LQIEAPVGTHLRHRHEITAMGSVVLLDLMGGVALLLWGLHMVLSGVLRALGHEVAMIASLWPGRALHAGFARFSEGFESRRYRQGVER
jgi:hypothetical protein